MVVVFDSRRGGLLIDFNSFIRSKHLFSKNHIELKLLLSGLPMHME